MHYCADRSTFQNANDDWEATSVIYADLDTQVSRNAKNGLTQSLALTIPMARVTFLRALTPDTHRVWTLPTVQSPVVRLIFGYATNEREALPTTVEITLISPYPPSWPAQEQLAWFAWLQAQAAEMLETQEMSYAVVAWMEHHALDYFGRAYERDGYSLIQFTDAGPTHYDLPTLLITSPPRPRRLVWHYPSGRTEETTYGQLFPTEEDDGPREGHIPPFSGDPEVWKPRRCPICLEDFLRDDMEQLDGCRECLELYLANKVEEVNTHRDNPFRCPLPSCRRGLPVIGFVKNYLTASHMEKVRQWYKDLKQPPCYALPDCLASSSCGRPGRMRQESVDSLTVFCEACNRRWCEWCLQKLTSGQGHGTSDCDAGLCIQWCQRYAAASPSARAACVAKWPWMPIYAQVRLERDSAAVWLKQNDGQQCPVCQTGVERSEGCFHMHCICGAHFCYECGEEISLLGIATVTSDVGNGDNCGSGGVAPFPDAMSLTR